MSTPIYPGATGVQFPLFGGMGEAPRDRTQAADQIKPRRGIPTLRNDQIFLPSRLYSWKGSEFKKAFEIH